MLILVFILPLIAALLCLVLSRAVPTRWLGAGSSASLLLCGAAVLFARLRGDLPLVLAERAWLALDKRSIAVSLQLDAANWLLAFLALAGGGLALLALALALPLNLRGFGGLFAAALLALVATAVGLASQNPVLLPFAWALAALLAFLALRASGALAGSDAPVIVLLAGLCGSLLALGAALLTPAVPAGAAVAPAALACWVALGLLALGAPPFHAPLQQLAEAPAALVGALLPLGLPLLGGYALIRAFAAFGVALPPIWRVALTLLGLLALVACAGGAAAETRLRRMVGWQLSAQMGLLLMAVGQGGASLTVAAPALLANASLTTLVCFLAVALLERRAGTDDLSQIALRAPLLLPGLIFLVGAAAGAGLPGTSGFWARRWLIDGLLGATPWAIAPLLAGGTLLALAYVAPLASFWRHAAPTMDEETAPGFGLGTALALVSAAGAVPLLLLGVAPQIAWRGWLAGAQRALAPALPPAPPALPGMATQVLCGLAVLALLALPALARSRRAGASASGTQVGVFAPQALGESVRGVARSATATDAFLAGWRGLLWASRTMWQALAVFEQRYYLAGLVIALIVVILLFIQ